MLVHLQLGTEVSGEEFLSRCGGRVIAVVDGSGTRRRVETTPFEELFSFFKISLGGANAGTHAVLLLWSWGWCSHHASPISAFVHEDDKRV